MLGHRWIGTLASALLLTAAAGCGDSGGSSDDGEGGAGNGGASSGECGLDPMSTTGDATTGTIKGTITVGDGVMAGGANENKGDIYLAVLPEFDPSNACTGNPKAPKAVAQALIRCGDFTGGKTVSYEVKGVPPRAEPYVVIPFVDVNGNVNADDPATAGPDTCDLLGAVPPPDALVAKAGDVAEVNLTLAGNAGILMQICGLPACE